VNEQYLLLIGYNGFEVVAIDEWGNPRQVSYGYTVTEALQRARATLGRDLTFELRMKP